MTIMICRILEKKRKYSDGGKNTFKVLSPFTCLSPVLLFDIVSGHVSNCFLVSNISSMAVGTIIKVVGTSTFCHKNEQECRIHTLTQFSFSKRSYTT